MSKKSALVVFGDQLPRRWLDSGRRYDAVVAPLPLRSTVEAAGLEWVSLEALVDPGSVYEATALLEELSYAKLADGTRITKSFLYKGYELWWIHGTGLFQYFCLPYTQHKRLLKYLQGFRSVDFYRLRYKSLFSCYFAAHSGRMAVLPEPGFKSPPFLPFGVLLQILLTLLFLPALMLRRRRLMVYTGDKFEKDKDYDFRMRFVYEELRKRRVPFVEFIRGLESWKTILQHAWVRKRAVVYTDAAAFVGRLASVLSGGHRRARQQFGTHTLAFETDPDTRFKLLVSTQYLLGVYDDVWAIRIMKLLLRAIGIRAGFVTVASERNFHTVLGCKLNGIPLTGILHGFASRYYNVSDFMQGFDGERGLSVDTYGVWSEWWKEYYLKNSCAYKPGQLRVSGPMRPLQRGAIPSAVLSPGGDSRIRVLFVSEQLGVPEETLPYLLALMEAKDISLYFKFRAYRDGFEEWLKENRPDILGKMDKAKIFRGGMQEAIAQCDAVVGSHSTAVLEALFQLKPPVFFQSKKWGDYFELRSIEEGSRLLAQTPQALLELVRKSASIPQETLKELLLKFFGDPYQNGSAWAVDRLEELLRRAGRL